MKLISFLAMLSVYMLLWACHQPAPRVQNAAAMQAQESDTMSHINIALNQLASPVDPVCGMNLKEGSIADTALIGGKIYGYCNSGCKEEDLKQRSSEKK